MEYTTRIVGAPNTFGARAYLGIQGIADTYSIAEHRVFIEEKGSNTPVSPFHDIPLFANEQKVP